MDPGTYSGDEKQDIGLNAKEEETTEENKYEQHSDVNRSNIESSMIEDVSLPPISPTNTMVKSTTRMTNNEKFSLPTIAKGSKRVARRHRSIFKPLFYKFKLVFELGHYF